MAFREHPASDYQSALDDGAQLIDVREPAEVAHGTLPGAVNIPLGSLAHRVADLDPARRIALLCRSGARSAAAGRYLVSLGFVDVVNLAGGMLAIADPGLRG